MSLWLLSVSILRSFKSFLRFEMSFLSSLNSDKRSSNLPDSSLRVKGPGPGCDSTSPSLRSDEKKNVAKDSDVVILSGVDDASTRGWIRYGESGRLHTPVTLRCCEMTQSHTTSDDVAKHDNTSNCKQICVRHSAQRAILRAHRRAQSV